MPVTQREAITAKENVGMLVGKAIGNSVIRNCKAGVISDNTVRSRAIGSKNVGGIAGYADEDVVIERCVSNCNVAGVNEKESSYAGGAVGFLKGKAFESISRGNVFLISGMAGGFAGKSEGDISDCAAFGSCETCVQASHEAPSGGFVGLQGGGRIDRCYSAGAVRNGEAWGGFAGNQTYGFNDYCYFDELTSKTSETAFGEKKQHEDMGIQETYEGFDFEEIWGFPDDEDEEIDDEDEEIEAEEGEAETDEEEAEAAAPAPKMHSYYPTPKALNEIQPLGGNKRQYLMQFKIHTPTFRAPYNWGGEFDGELVSNQTISINGRVKHEPVIISEGYVNWLAESEFGYDLLGVSGSCELKYDKVIEANAVWNESKNKTALSAMNVGIEDKWIAFGFVAGNGIAFDKDYRFYVNGSPSALHKDSSLFKDALIYYGEPDKEFNWLILSGDRRGRGTYKPGETDNPIDVILKYFAFAHGKSVSHPEEGFKPKGTRGDAILGALLSVADLHSETNNLIAAHFYGYGGDFVNGKASIEARKGARIEVAAYDSDGKPIELDVDHIKVLHDEVIEMNAYLGKLKTGRGR